MMKQVYRFNGEGFDVAWIGKTAPVPEGFYLDANSAREVFDPVKKGKSNAVRKEEKGQGRSEEVTVTDEPDISVMDKDGLKTFARDRWGIDLDKRKKRESLLEEVQGYLDAE